MLSLAFYKTVHYLGIFTLVTALVASLARAAGAKKSPAAPADTLSGPAPADPWGKRLGIAHGVGLFLVLLGGFGLLARMGVGFPGWVVAKLVLWLAAGALIVLRKNASTAGWGVVAVPILAFLAGWIAYTKPF